MVGAMQESLSGNDNIFIEHAFCDVYGSYSFNVFKQYYAVIGEIDSLEAEIGWEWFWNYI